MPVSLLLSSQVTDTASNISGDPVVILFQYSTVSDLNTSFCAWNYKKKILAQIYVYLFVYSNIAKLLSLPTDKHNQYWLQSLLSKKTYSWTLFQFLVLTINHDVSGYLIQENKYQLFMTHFANFSVLRNWLSREQVVQQWLFTCQLKAFSCACIVNVTNQILSIPNI